MRDWKKIAKQINKTEDESDYKNWSRSLND